MVILNPDHPPRLDTFHFSLRGPFLYAIFIIFCNVAVPCVSLSVQGQMVCFRWADPFAGGQQIIYYPTQICTLFSSGARS